MMNPISLVIYMMIVHSASPPLENFAADCSLAKELCLGLLPVATHSAADITMPRKYLHLPPAPRTGFDGKIPLDATFVLFDQILMVAPLAILMAVGILLWRCCPCLRFQVPWASHQDVMNALERAEKKHKETLDQAIQDMETRMSSSLGELGSCVKNMVNINAVANKDMDYKLGCLETKCQKVVDETSDALTHIKSISLDLNNILCAVKDLHSRVASIGRMLEKFEVKHDEF